MAHPAIPAHASHGAGRWSDPSGHRAGSETTWNEETEEYETETRKMRAKNHRFTYAWSRRAGVNIALHRFTRSSTRLALDVSVGEHGNGRTQYGIPGEKEKLATGKTRYRVWLVGLSVMNR